MFSFEACLTNITNILNLSQQYSYWCANLTIKLLQDLNLKYIVNYMISKILKSKKSKINFA